jgi:hypothetical protein
MKNNSGGKRMGLRPHVICPHVICVITLAGWMLMAGAAYCGDAPLPPEVQALIGMKLPPVRVEGKDIKMHPDIKQRPDFVFMQTHIPGYTHIEGNIASLKDKPGSQLWYETGFIGGKWPVLLVRRLHKDMSYEILDAQMLPANLIEWTFANGKLQDVKGRFRLSGYCQIGNKEDVSRTIVGLIKPEKGKSDCSHDSRRVKQAWEIDQQSGHVAPISTQGLQCHYLMMYDCF